MLIKLCVDCNGLALVRDPLLFLILVVLFSIGSYNYKTKNKKVESNRLLFSKNEEKIEFIFENETDSLLKGTSTTLSRM